ncbi:hypothetical protein EG327_005932 [Venturia inaequalis]|uniref:Nonsense-mediated mRNA decay factor n=2 Tax=Venturia inaequalis TaxID=5025 RepID=A0A8H3V337_VENIN|nr:hypothetical protein EG327_005932 [Venturia inaequalis]
MSWDARYVAHARQRARQASPSNQKASCPFCSQRLLPADSDAFSSHLTESHSDEIQRHEADPNWNFEDWKKSLELRAGLSTTSIHLYQSAHAASRPSPARDLSNLNLNHSISPAPASQSPTFPPDGDPGGTSARNHAHEDKSSSQFRGHHFNDQGQLVSRQLFNPVSETSTSQATFTTHTFSSTPGAQLTSSSRTASIPTSDRTGSSVSHDIASQSSRPLGGISMPIDPRYPDMLMQPDSRPISQQQLAAEVKSIYAGLTMVESKCIHVDRAQASAMRSADSSQKPKLADDHWQALIALHRTLLHEHHDFFLASQHPSASPALRRLAAKYSMPSRMWKHGIHSFLELLRFRLPDSLEFMISFIYTAYQMMSLLYETVPAFEDTWIECLGDLGRYRMAIEDEDIRDRETWAGVARFWYSKAADRSPDVGRLYHHLAILARPNALQQLYLYSRSLISTQPFHSTRDSILTLFNPIMARQETSSPNITTIDTNFIKIHAILFGKEKLEQYEALRKSFIDALDAHISRVTAKWREQGAYVMIANLGALYDYGTESPLRRFFELGCARLDAPGNPQPSETPATIALRSEPINTTFAPLPKPDSSSLLAYGYALDLTVSTASLVFQRIGDNNVLPFAHVLLSFLLSLASLQSSDFQVERNYVAGSLLSAIPWKDICAFLNTLGRSMQPPPYFESAQFIRPQQGDDRPLPEDHLIRGQVWSQKYFPDDWFKESEIDDEERSIEHASTVRVRAERVLWIAFHLASFKSWIIFDAVNKSWSIVAPSSLGLSEPTDLLMPDVDPGDVSDEDSTEMKTLKKELSLSPPNDVDSTILHAQSHIPTQAAEMIQKSYTVMVCDKKLFLKDHDLFESLIKNEWKVVIPHQVFADLSLLSKSVDADSVAAQQALKSVKNAYVGHSDIRILTVDGEDTTKRHLACERSTATGCSSPLKASDNSEEKTDDLIGVTRRATDLNSFAKPKEATDQTRPAILLTEDISTRILAKSGKVASLAPSVFRRVFSTASRVRSRALSGATKSPDHFRGGKLDANAMELT